MALTANFEYTVKGKTEINEFKGGAADTFYKGAIASIGTDGYIKVGANVADEIPIGVFKKQIIEDGTHLDVEVETKRIWLKKKTQHVSTVLFTDESAGSNAAYNSKYFLLYNGTTAYYVWFDVNSTGVDPAVTGATGIEVDIGTTDNDDAVAAAATAAIDALAGFGASASTATMTVTAVTKGYTIPTADGDLLTVVTITNTVYSGVIQADVGTLFFCIDDDGVVYDAAKGSSTIPVGLCIEISGNEDLLIDFRTKTLS